MSSLISRDKTKTLSLAVCDHVAEFGVTRDRLFAAVPEGQTPAVDAILAALDPSRQPPAAAKAKAGEEKKEDPIPPRADDGADKAAEEEEDPARLPQTMKSTMPARRRSLPLTMGSTKQRQRAPSSLLQTVKAKLRAKLKATKLTKRMIARAGAEATAVAASPRDRRLAAAASASCLRAMTVARSRP
jgi:hypothetical protein